MNFITGVSKGWQAVVGGLGAVAGTVLTVAPNIVPFLGPKQQQTAGVIIGIAGAITATLSHPPVTPISGTSVSPKVADKLGLPRG